MRLATSIARAIPGCRCIALEFTKNDLSGTIRAGRLDLLLRNATSGGIVLGVGCIRCMVFVADCYGMRNCFCKTSQSLVTSCVGDITIAFFTPAMDREIDPVIVLPCGRINRFVFHPVPRFLLVFVCFN